MDTVIHAVAAVLPRSLSFLLTGDAVEGAISRNLRASVEIQQEGKGRGGRKYR